MIHASVSAELDASCDAAFDLVHDYPRRLSWDTLLRQAFIEEGKEPGVGAVAVCSGRWFLGGITMRTEYVSFQRGKVAAVKMLNQPIFFARWAASIRHEALGEHRSRITYSYTFHARRLAFVVEPVLAAAFRWETRRRLLALARVLAQKRSGGSSS